MRAAISIIIIISIIRLYCVIVLYHHISILTTRHEHRVTSAGVISNLYTGNLRMSGICLQPASKVLPVIRYSR